jgi:hypothetical protein
VVWAAWACNCLAAWPEHFGTLAPSQKPREKSRGFFFVPAASRTVRLISDDATLFVVFGSAGLAQTESGLGHGHADSGASESPHQTGRGITRLSWPSERQPRADLARGPFSVAPKGGFDITCPQRCRCRLPPLLRRGSGRATKRLFAPSPGCSRSANPTRLAQREPAPRVAPTHHLIPI